MQLNVYSTCFIVCAVISFTCAKKIVPISPVIINAVRPIEDQCIQESGSIPDSLKHMLAYTLPNNMNSKKFMHCFCVKSGYTDETGHFVIDKFLIAIKDEVDLKDDFVNMLNKCNESKGDEVIELVYKMVECFHQSSPIKFAI